MLAQLFGIRSLKELLLELLHLCLRLQFELLFGSDKRVFHSIGLVDELEFEFENGGLQHFGCLLMRMPQICQLGLMPLLQTLQVILVVFGSVGYFVVESGDDVAAYLQRLLVLADLLLQLVPLSQQDLVPVLL